MRKYGETAVIYFKAQLIWRADAVFNMLFTITKIIFAYVLWGAVFEGKESIAGFTFHSMLSYYIISSFLSQIEMSGGISGEISSRIRNGTFSKYMVIPMNIEKYFLAMEAGVVAFYLLFDFLAAGVWIFIFRIRFIFTSDAFVITCAVLMVFLGLLFMVQLNYYLGLLTLRYEEISTFLMIKDNLISLITGTIVPLTLLPGGMIAWMRLLPFYYVTYLPSMLFTGRCGEEALRGVIILAGWCIFMELLNRRTYQKYRLKYDGVGI
nr:ABC transporter permease [uncultured Eisenbergiella sp.]